MFLFLFLIKVGIPKIHRTAVYVKAKGRFLAPGATEGVPEHIAGRPRRQASGRTGNEAERPSPEKNRCRRAGALIFKLVLIEPSFPHQILIIKSQYSPTQIL
jgi:hypothetical protein